PEQLEGKEADARSDIFAFGAVLYQMATGRKAFQANSQASLIAAILEREPRPLSELQPLAPPGLERLVKTWETLAVARRVTQGMTSIWLTDVKRGTSTRFTSEWFSSTPRWTPGGEAVAFSSARDSPPNLYLKTLAGSEKRLIKAPLQCYASDWSRDARLLVYQCFDAKTKADIWLLSMEEPGAEAQPSAFLRTPASELGGRLSPDGKWIAFTSDESGKNEVYVTSFPTPGRKWQVSTKGGTEPRWSANGKEMFYVQDDRKLMAVNVSIQTGFRAGAPAELFSPAAAWGSLYLPDRDGRRFLVNLEVEKAAPPPIHVVLNWPVGLERQ
ncbi:MAG: hypothetical protein ACREUU_14600, partial [Gammaproteobacteria bacterium]